jgi:hypothetical protein
VYSLTAATLALLGGVWLNAAPLSWLRRDLAQRKDWDPASMSTVNAAGFVGRRMLRTPKKREEILYSTSKGAV